MQPKLIVSNNMADQLPLKQSQTQIAQNQQKLKSKKSKSQTISAQNFKSKKRRGLVDILDQTVAHQKQSQHEDEKDLTLKILNSSADNVQKYRTKQSKVQMKAMNYQRKSVRSLALKPLNKTQSTSADKIQRFAGSLSPRSKTGNAAFSKVICDQKRKSDKKITELQMLTNERPSKSSDMLFRKHQNTSAQPLECSEIQFLPVNLQNQRSNPNMRKHKRSMSPDRVSKVEQLIRNNIREKSLAEQSKLKEVREREASSQRRKTLLEQKNQYIRKLNNQKLQRRKLKLKENMTIFGEVRDASETKLFEEALLAVSDGVNLLKDVRKSPDNLKLGANAQRKSMKTLQTRIRQALQEMPSRTQGMDFIGVRKEISNELKQAKSKKHLTNSWIDTVNLQTSKSYPKQLHQNSLSTNNQCKLLSQVKEGNLLGKREKIRKFMKEKAKQFHTKAEAQRVAELSQLCKLKTNLIKLSKFTSSKPSGIQTPHLKVQRNLKKNKSVYHDDRRLSQGATHTKKYVPLRHQENTPSRTGIFERSDASFNISGNRGLNNRSTFGHVTQKDLQKIHDTLYEDSRLSSIDTHQEDRSQKRAVSKVLSVCFEKSASQKRFRRSSHSPSSKRDSSKQKRPILALSISKSAKRKVKSAPKHRSKGRFVMVDGKISHSAKKAEKDEMTLKLQMSDHSAAKIIQKEVRKFLLSLGFYEARPTKSSLMSSPERSQVNIYTKNVGSQRSTSRKSKLSSSQRRSPDYQLVDLKSSKKSSIKLHISPQQLRDLIEIEKQAQRQLTLIESERPIDTSDEKQGSEQQQKVPPLVWGGGFIKTLVSSPTYSQRQHQEAHSQSSNSIFDRNRSFSQYNQQDLARLIKDNEIQKLIQFREECVQVRESNERQLIQKLYQDNQLTPRTYQSREQKLEKWVTIQRREIEKTKMGFQQEWEKTLKMIEDTQKGVDQIKSKIGNDSNSQASSRANQTKPPRSILIDEAPRTYRNPLSQDFDQNSSASPQTSRGLKHDSELLQLQLGIKQKSRQDNLQDNSMTENPLSKETLPRLQQVQSMTSEKDRSHHQRVSSQTDSDQQPSQEFINRLEKAFQPRGSAEGTLKLDEEFDKHQQSDTFEDGNFKNKLVQLKDLMFDQEIQRESSSEHKSEPMMLDDNNHSDDDFTNQRIQALLQRSSKQKQPPLDQPKTPKQNTTELINNQMADQIANVLIEQFIKECFDIPKRQPPKGGPMPSQGEVFSMDVYSLEREERKEWIEIRQRHLIEGCLIRADQYVNEIVESLLQFDIDDVSENSQFDYQVSPDDNYHIQFLKQLTQPIRRAPVDSLQLLQQSDLGSYRHFETTWDNKQYPITPVALYIDIEKQHEVQFVKRKATADKRTQQVWESIHIFNKCIFDSVNESLMKFRPYGLVGLPMPWSNKVRRLQTKVEIASVDTERLFQMVKQEIFRWNSVLCGCLPGPVFYFQSVKSGKDEFQEDLFQEVRERRLTAMLTSDQIEQEHHWLNYEFEETQVKIDLSDFILETLVQEMIQLLNQ